MFFRLCSPSKMRSRTQIFLGLLRKVAANAFLHLRPTISWFSIQRDEPIPEALKERLAHLAGERIIERVGGRSRGGRFILSRSLYSFIGKRRVYTRAKGLDRETNKALLRRTASAVTKSTKKASACRRAMFPPRSGSSPANHCHWHFVAQAIFLRPDPVLTTHTRRGAKR